MFELELAETTSRETKLWLFEMFDHWTHENVEGLYNGWKDVFTSAYPGFEQSNAIPLMFMAFVGGIQYGAEYGELAKKLN